MRVILKLIAMTSIVIGLVVGSRSTFSATHCPVLLSELKTGTNYGIILKDTESRGLTGVVTKVDSSKCLVTITYYAEGKIAIVDGNSIRVILENP